MRIVRENNFLDTEKKKNFSVCRRTLLHRCRTLSEAAEMGLHLRTKDRSCSFKQEEVRNSEKGNKMLKDDKVKKGNAFP